VIYSSNVRKRLHAVAFSISMPHSPDSRSVSPIKAASWSIFYRFNGRLRRYTIGRYPAIKPAQARREAAAALERVREGSSS
jgi:hypothetical protein